MLRLLRNLAVIFSFLGAVAAIVAGTWWFMPDSSRSALRDPHSTLRSAERGVRGGPADPLSAFADWIREWLASQRDRNDVVRAADGTTGGLLPLPPWASADSRRFFGATETLWQSRRAQLAGVRWSRVVFYWSEVQPRGPREWRAHYYLRDDIIRRERNNGVEIVGLLMGTPEWAARDPQQSVRSVPAGLDLPLDDPRNYWSTFVRRMAREYRDRIDTWIIWNEPDIQPTDPNAQYHAFAGDAADYARLLRTGYLSAKQGNPNARVLFAATTYWGDVNHGRALFLERVLDVLQEDPQAAAHGYYFDALAINLYSSPDDLRRLAGVYRDVLAKYSLEKPLWITETNAVPYDDPSQGLSRDQDGLRVSMEQQASFVIQAYAMGLAAGYERMAFHSMMDRDTMDEVWGLVRNDGSLRPAFIAYQTAARYLSGTERVHFAPIERSTWHWSRDGFVPNWQVYRVSLDRASSAPLPPRPNGDTAQEKPNLGTVQRISVLWNGDGTTLKIGVRRAGTRGTLLDKYGRSVSLGADDEHWLITLPAAEAHSPLDPEGYFFIGGDPLILVEENVQPSAPVDAPVLVD